MKLRDLIDEAKINFPANLKVVKHHDVISGDQISLKNNNKIFGSTTEAENHKVFWTNGRGAARLLLKQIGEKTFIKLLYKYYKIKVDEVM